MCLQSRFYTKRRYLVFDQNHLSDDEVKKKFRYLSRNFCGDDKTEEIIKKIDTLEKIKNLGEVSGLLQAD
jgi:hypothetical protein